MGTTPDKRESAVLCGSAQVLKHNKLHADKGYDYRHLRLALRKRRIIPGIARCGTEPKNRLGRYRRVVERTLSRLNRFRRLKICYEHRADLHLAFLQRGCALLFLGCLG